MDHYERLKNIYSLAPIHNFYEGIALEIEKGKAVVSLEIDSRYFHGAMAVHGSVYFKLLDDAAYFACQSEIFDYFILTTDFNTQLKRPIKKGRIKAFGEVITIDERHITAKSILIDENGNLCGEGTGSFKKSKIQLDSLIT